MTIREQFSWVWLATLTVTYGAYFIAVAVLRPDLAASPVDGLIVLAVATVTQMGLLGLFWLVHKVRTGALRPPARDERDRAIEHRSSSIAYNVLIAGMILVGCVMPFSKGGWQLVHAAILAIVVAELVHHGAVVVGYRRGWRA